MHQHLKHHSMRALCQAFDVSRSGYYAWLKRKECVKPLTARVSQAFASHQGRAGAPKLA